jgi:hypothetical protein
MKRSTDVNPTSVARKLMISMPSMKAAIALGLALLDDAFEREDAFARELDDPALRTFVSGPGLHVPVAFFVERGIFGV